VLSLVPFSLYFFFLLIRPPPSSTLFPYTTLFRSTSRFRELYTLALSPNWRPFEFFSQATSFLGKKLKGQSPAMSMPHSTKRLTAPRIFFILLGFLSRSGLMLNALGITSSIVYRNRVTRFVLVFIVANVPKSGLAVYRTSRTGVTASVETGWFNRVASSRFEWQPTGFNSPAEPASTWMRA